MRLKLYTAWVTDGRMIKSQTKRRFGLRSKLLLVSIALLIIPWAGYEYLREMEAFLKKNKQDTLVQYAQTIATVLHNRRTLFEPTADITASLNDQSNIYVRQLKQAIQLDGYTEDWASHLEHARQYKGESLIQGNIPYEENSLSFKHLFGKYKNFFYTLLLVNDDKLVYRKPNSLRLDQSDHLLIAMLDKQGNKQRYILSTQAPGWVSAFLLPADNSSFTPVRPEIRIKGEWQETASGYNLELRIPESMLGNKISFSIADVDDAKHPAVKYLLSTTRSQTTNKLGSILTPSPDIENILQGISQGNARIWIINRNRHVLALTGSLNASNPYEYPSENNAIGHFVAPIYRLLFKQPEQHIDDNVEGVARLNSPDVIAALKGKPATNWRRADNNHAVILSASHPVKDNGDIIGAVVVEQTNADIQTLQNNALKTLMNVTIIVFLAATVFLLVFATRLSSRIRQLHKQTDAAISDDGRVQDIIQASSSSDELGDLSRSFSDMMTRLQDYTRYLETMASKLSHELRTPLAVVRSSLDNLEMENLPDTARPYTARASEGIQRLGTILTSINEATRLEQALQSSDTEIFNSIDLVAGCFEGYKLAYPDQQFIFNSDCDKAIIEGYPDRIAQLLDKLITNAMDFCKEGTSITIDCHCNPTHLNLSVTNIGQALPTTMQGQLFDSMVSVREGKQSDTHLGLGLFIVRLIAEFHGGHVRADNLPGNIGVCFRVSLPTV